VGAVFAYTCNKCISPKMSVILIPTFGEVRCLRYKL